MSSSLTSDPKQAQSEKRATFRTFFLLCDPQPMTWALICFINLTVINEMSRYMQGD